MTSENAHEHAKLSPLFVGSVKKAFSVLETFKHGVSSLSMSEIMAALCINKSTAQRYLHTLEALGYIEKDAQSKRYVLTLKVLMLASSFQSTNSLINSAYPHIVELRQLINARVGVSVVIEHQAAYSIPLQHHSEAYQTDYAGFSVPLHCTTTGRMWLSYKKDNEVIEILEKLERKSFTPYTITDIDQIMVEVDKARQQVYSLTVQEYVIGQNNICVPLTNRDGGLVACMVAVLGNVNFNEQIMINEVLPIMREHARRIAVKL